MKWRKWNNILHRDLGYIFFGMTVIYSLSGIALNHRADFNPNYSLTHTEVQWDQRYSEGELVPKAAVLELLEQTDLAGEYKMHYQPLPDAMRVFLKSGGTLDVNLATGHGLIEKLEKRPLLFEVNFLHYNPQRLWTWFSDLFCVALILICITGLFVLRGKKGITGRGAWLTGVGLVVPLVFLMMYL